MRLLVIGSDRNLFKKGSDIWNRYLDYGKLFKEIHIIVFSHKNLGNKNIKIGDNVFVYPTNHIFKPLYLWNIFKISKLIISNLESLAANSNHLIIKSLNHLIVSSQDPFESGLAAWMLKKIYKIPLQIQIHTDFLSPYFWQESFTNKLRVILAKFIIYRADGIRVVSERIKQSLIKNLKLKIKNLNIDVLPIFIDVEAIKTAPITINLHDKYPQFDFVILMASRLTKEKNIGLAIESMSELVKKYPKLGLVIVGSGPELESLKILNSKLKIKNLKLHDFIVLESSVSQETLFSYYKTADLFLLTSNYEGYGRTVIEAMASGLPVVMTNVGLAGEDVINGQNGIVVPVGDSGAIVDSISLLIIDENKREYFSMDAFKALDKLTKKEQYLELYKQSIESCLLNNQS